MRHGQWWAEELQGLSVLRSTVVVSGGRCGDAAGGGEREVHLVAVRSLLDEAPEWLALSDDDRDRVARMRLLDDRRRFWTGRALTVAGTRALFGDTSGWSFVAESRARGTSKPAWVRDFTGRVRAGSAGLEVAVSDDAGLGAVQLPHVSISHAESVVIVALCGDAEVGVDVQDCAAFRGAGGELEVMFRPAERRAWRSLDDVAAAFTAKEAVLKAVGWGLAVDPLAVEVAEGRVVAFDAPQARPVALQRLSWPVEWGEYAMHLAVVREGRAGCWSVSDRMPGA